MNRGGCSLYDCKNKTMQGVGRLFLVAKLLFASWTNVQEQITQMLPNCKGGIYNFVLYGNWMNPSNS